MLRYIFVSCHVIELPYQIERFSFKFFAFFGYTTMGFPGGSVVKNLPANEGDARHLGSISGSGRGLGGGNGNSPQYSCLENPMDWTEEPGGL